MIINPKLYEINTRVWIKQFGEDKKFPDIPLDYFKELKEKGIDIIWLMGVWKTCPQLIKDHCFSPELVTNYSKALNDWKDEDVIGSPYSIDKYELNPMFGTMDDLKNLRNELNKIGLKLMLDFISNHFCAGTSLLKTNPEIFLEADRTFLNRDSFTFYQFEDKVFSHGRDPLFPAWTDTVQVNYFSEKARSFMTEQLLKVTDYCDGVRCDMAMLPLNNVFHNTWLGVLNKYGFEKPKNEFWQTAIKKVKKKSNDFIFLGEAYWDLEWDLQKLGFDFTYDKRLTDRLAANDIWGVKSHLGADKDFQLKSARFIENHDEPRAITLFGERKSLVSAVVMSTIMGMKIYFDGQFEGVKTKLPVQLGRAPNEKPLGTVEKFYNKLLKITNEDIFKKGEWQILMPSPAGTNNWTFENIFSWQWQFKNDLRIVVINFSKDTARCRLKFEVPVKKEKIVLIDLLSSDRYERSVDEIKNVGLFIELKSYFCHIFAIEK